MSTRANDRVYPQGSTAYGGMTIREHFAGLVGEDAEKCAYGMFSQQAKAILVGRARPEAPSQENNPSPEYTAAVIGYQIAAYRWELDVHAVMRCMAADALISALEKTK